MQNFSCYINCERMYAVIQKIVENMSGKTNANKREISKLVNEYNSYKKKNKIRNFRFHPEKALTGNVFKEFLIC